MKKYHELVDVADYPDFQRILLISELPKTCTRENVRQYFQGNFPLHENANLRSPLALKSSHNPPNP